jgi:hypothetical protein
VVLLTGASSVRSLIVQFGMLDRSPSVAGVKEAIAIEFVDIIPQDFRNFRATKCNVMASISSCSILL